MSDTLYAVKSGFFDAINHDRLYSADDMNQPYKEILTEGIDAGGFEVTPQSTPDMTITVAAGHAFLGGKWVDAAAKTLTVPENTTLYGRIDAVVLRVDINSDVRAANLIYRTGTPADTPEAPALIGTTGIYEVRLANIAVAASATAIAAAQITDKRGGTDCPYADIKLGQLVREQQIAEDVSSWLTEHVDPVGSAVVVDDSLSIAGAAADAKKTGDEISGLKDALVQFDNKIHYKSQNLYDASKQTDETISPHFFYNGEPYSSTSYDNDYHCVDFIEVEPETEYTVGLVPPKGSNVKPWGTSTQGLFCYDENKNYISGSNKTNNTFTTPALTKYIRFNWWVGNFDLATLNSKCMLVKGSSLPETYEPFYDYYVKEKIESIEEEINNVSVIHPINYIIDQDGNGVTLISKYDASHDVAISIKKKGGNNLFDFYSIGLIPNQNKAISQDTTGISYLISSSGDWHAPFVVKASANGDGDNPTSKYFTGGNHQYNNQSSGSTPTARTSVLKFFADKMEVTSGSGSCSEFEMVWTNLVQGYNTTKADGSGREILQENHRMIFDGTLFDDFVDLIPLEDVIMETWYGYQWTFSPYKYTRYIGATSSHRALYDASSANSSSGGKTCCFVRGYGTTDEIRIGIDADYDLGDHKFFTNAGGTGAIFTQTYGKGYFFVIDGDQEMGNGNIYSLHGSYQFVAHN